MFRGRAPSVSAVHRPVVSPEGTPQRVGGPRPDAGRDGVTSGQGEPVLQSLCTPVNSAERIGLKVRKDGGEHCYCYPLDKVPIRILGDWRPE
jgi:hypothetical protein